MVDCDIIISEYELQSCYYIHLQTNALWERHEPPYPSMLDCNIIVSSNSSHAITFTFRLMTLGKGMNPLIPFPSYWLNNTTTVLSTMMAMKVDMSLNKETKLLNAWGRDTTLVHITWKFWILCNIPRKRASCSIYHIPFNILFHFKDPIPHQIFQKLICIYVISRTMKFFPLLISGFS